MAGVEDAPSPNPGGTTDFPPGKWAFFCSECKWWTNQPAKHQFSWLSCLSQLGHFYFLFSNHHMYHLWNTHSSSPPPFKIVRNCCGFKAPGRWFFHIKVPANQHCARLASLQAHRTSFSWVLFGRGKNGMFEQNTRRALPQQAHCCLSNMHLNAPYWSVNAVPWKSTLLYLHLHTEIAIAH